MKLFLNKSKQGGKVRYLNLAINELDLYLDYTVFSIMAIYVLSSNSLEIGIMGACFTAP